MCWAFYKEANSPDRISIYYKSMPHFLPELRGLFSLIFFSSKNRYFSCCGVGWYVFVCVCMCISVFGCVHAHTCHMQSCSCHGACRSEGQYWRVSSLFLLYVDSGHFSRSVWIVQHWPHLLSLTPILSFPSCW